MLGRGTRALHAARRWLYLFTTMVHTGALGALLTLSPMPGIRATSDAPLGSASMPLEDQQLGGLVMWVPAGLAYVVAGLALTSRWIGFGSRPQRITPAA